MITTSNYKKSIDKIGVENLPAELREAHNFLHTATLNFTNWNVAGEEFEQVKTLAFEKLHQLATGNQSLNGKPLPPNFKQAKEDAKNYQWMETPQLKMIYRLELDAELEGDGSPEERKIRRKALEKELKKRGESLSGSEAYDSLKEIQFIERFLAFHDKRIYKNTILLFIKDLQKAILEKKIRKHSPYAQLILRVQEIAINFYNKANHVNHLLLSKELMKSLNKAILDYENKISRPEKKEKLKPVALSGIAEKKDEGKVLCSTEFTQLEFKTLGFSEKWYELIGDPAPGFTAMVFGKPKMGKSYLCVDFAGYLARNFGKVLYVAKEEKLDATLQKKLKDKDVAHVNLFVSDTLPSDLAPYDFIFLDSVNLLGLSPKELRELKAKYPGKGFIYVFQTTKTGNFRGANSFQHDVDVVIEVPEKGKAVQFGRFNQGGKMEIFEQDSIAG